jgi:hypothetical protein
MFKAWLGNNGTAFQQFENMWPSDWNEEQRRHSLGENGLVFIQVRDYLNFSASWFKYLIKRNQAYRERKAQNVLDVWYALAREAAGATNYIPNNEILLYDLFVLSNEYRRQVCDMIGGKYNEVALDIVPNNGHHSSFDGNKFEGMGSKMHVTSRWEWYLTEEGKEFKQYLAAKPEILAFYVELFNPNEKKMEFINSIL